MTTYNCVGTSFGGVSTDGIIEQVEEFSSMFTESIVSSLFGNSFKNTMDEYTGAWSSFPVYSRFFLMSEMVDNLSDAIDLVKIQHKTNWDISGITSEWMIVGAELNYLCNTDIMPHCDNVNADSDRIRVLVYLSGDPLDVTIDGITISMYNDYSSYEVSDSISDVNTIMFDCTNVHSGNISGSCAFLIIDFMKKDITIPQEIVYMSNSFEYYLSKL